MKRGFYALVVIIVIAGVWGCQKTETTEGEADELTRFGEMTGLWAEYISYENIINGSAPPRFRAQTGADYKPSRNEDPAVPAQCWVETGYGTQNACQYCHTNYLWDIRHGNAFPLAEDQILYSFPSPNLNRVNWRNIIFPQDIIRRLEEEKLAVPQPDDPGNLRYVRQDNWRAAFGKARSLGDQSWNNLSNQESDLQLFPALDPDDLFPYTEADPTGGGRHGYVDGEGFVRDRNSGYTGWRAVNFFPYAIFTPLTGSVSGIYIRLPRRYMTQDGEPDIDIYKRNLDLLEQNIKNQDLPSTSYVGDAADMDLKKGFYPVGTEFAHPLHYVDLNADGELGVGLDGLEINADIDYEFPGTRSKRVKEIRYMYKWKDVDLEDIGEDEHEGEEMAQVIGKEWKGWIDNGAGWILAAYIERRDGELRPQTTEELLQCKGCHSSVGNTVDAVWSFQRKLPGSSGWGEMDYGQYRRTESDRTHLQDYMNANTDMGELEYFYYTVVGADLFGIMPSEIKTELMAHAEQEGLIEELRLANRLEDIFDDERLKMTERTKRKEILQERAKIMRHYASSRSYLTHDPESGKDFIKGAIFYPSQETALANISGYRRIVLDQSYNLGKNVFGSQPEAIPFTFRSDGTVFNADGEIIPLGAVIDSRPWGEDGVGITPTGVVKVNDEGLPVDEEGRVVDIETSPEKAVGHVSQGGTFETRYNPIIKGKPVTKKK